MKTRRKIQPNNLAYVVTFLGGLKKRKCRSLKKGRPQVVTNEDGVKITL